MAGLAAIGIGIFSSLGRYQSDQNNASNAEMLGRYRSSIDTENAALADRQAANIITAGKQAEDRERLGTQLEIGATRASYGSQGVAVDSGSAVNTQATEAGLGELDALTIRNNAANEAYGYTVQGFNDRKAAIVDTMEGNNAAQGYRNDATSTLLTGAVSTYGLFSNYMRNQQANQDQNPSQPNRSTSPYRPPGLPRSGGMRY